jgi:hypothetical protein
MFFIEFLITENFSSWSKLSNCWLEVQQSNYDYLGSQQSSHDY